MGQKNLLKETLPIIDNFLQHINYSENQLVQNGNLVKLDKKAKGHRGGFGG